MPAKLKQISIVGVGLIGGSIGLAARHRGLADQVMGVGRHADRLRAAQALGAIDAATTDLGEGVARADVVIVCTPVRFVARMVCEAALDAPATALITDAGSTKAGIVADVERVLPPHLHFVGSHPLAGSHESGVAAAQRELFEDRTVVITPTGRTPAADVERVTEFWKALGAIVVRMSPAAHDRALAATSHLPHLLAATLAGTTSKDLLPLAASGWKDATRTAAGDVELWRDIFSANRDNVLEALCELNKALEVWIDVLGRQDEVGILELLRAGKQRRDTVGN